LGKISQLTVGVDDGAFVGGDGVGSMVESGADVGDRGLAGFDVERSGFEEDFGASGGEPSLGLLGGSRGPRGLKPAA
jgi:hypothetical protein